MLAFCTSPSEISVVLGPSDAKWLGEEMSFLAELYSSKADTSRRQFGEDYNPALASFCETAPAWLGSPVARAWLAAPSARVSVGPPL